MAFIPDKDMQQLRADIKKHYGIDIAERITRVEFVAQGGGCTYMHTDDRFEPPKPQEEKVEYLLHIMDGSSPMQFATKEGLKRGFELQKTYNQHCFFPHRVVATINGAVKWEFTPKNK